MKTTASGLIFLVVCGLAGCGKDSRSAGGGPTSEMKVAEAKKNAPEAAAKPKLPPQKFVCKLTGSKAEDTFLVDFDAETVQSGEVVLGGPNGPTEYHFTDLSITKDFIKFTQRLNIGPAVMVRPVSIDRRDGTFTSQYSSETKPSTGKCMVVGDKTTSAASTKQDAPAPGPKASTVVGKVKSVSMENDVEFNFATATGKDNGKQPSVVLIELEGRGKESFEIPTDKLVQLNGFKDLNGKQQALGGLLVLSPLKERLEEKTMELTYTDANTKNGFTQYLVTNIKPATLR
jgi:hypothetical protein